MGYVGAMKNKIESIQILRGLAALAVVLFHYRFYLVPDGADRTVPDSLFGWGGIGVDLFFVISGFIMVYVTDGKGYGLKTSANFIVNRLIRIVPMYYLILLVAFLTGGAMSTFHYADKVDNLISALTFRPYLQNPAPLYIDSSGMYNVRWTLNYEIYFYMAFSLCLLIKPRLIALAFWFALPVVVVYYLKGEFTLSAKGYAFDSVFAKFLTNPIILEFGFGALAGFVYKKASHYVEGKSASVPILIATAIGMAIYTRELTAYNLLSGIAFSVLVLTFALYSNVVTLFFPKCLITLGNISFSLYLIHNPLASFISGKVEKLFPGIMHSVPGFVILIAVSIIVANLSYHYIETRLTLKLRKAFHLSSSHSSQGITTGTPAS